MSKILLIGGTGQLGSAINRVKNNYNGEIISLSSNEIDIRNKSSIEKELDEYKPSHVINTAAYTNVVEAEKNPALAFELNATAVSKLSNACIERKIPLTHISTDYVFGSHQMKVLQEHGEVNPLNIYGVSKLGGEVAVKSLFGLAHLPWQIIRISFLYGIKENQSKGTFLLNMLRKLNNGETLKLVKDSYITPTNADDAAKFILHNLDFKDGIYHATNSGTTTPYEFIHTAAKFMNSLGSNFDLDKIVPVSTTSFKDSVVRPRFSYMGTDYKKTYRMPHWETSLENFLKEHRQEINL